MALAVHSIRHCRASLGRKVRTQAGVLPPSTAPATASNLTHSTARPASNCRATSWTRTPATSLFVPRSRRRTLSRRPRTSWNRCDRRCGTESCLHPPSHRCCACARGPTSQEGVSLDALEQAVRRHVLGSTRACMSLTHAVRDWGWWTGPRPSREAKQNDASGEEPAVHHPAVGLARVVLAQWHAASLGARAHSYRGHRRVC